MRIFFLVQGEGRGHLTQALALSEIIQQAGHELTGVLLGQAEGREIPDFFIKKINAPVFPFKSPGLIFDHQKNRIDIATTIRVHLANAPTYLKSLKTIHQRVEEARPDLLVNFYEMLGGIYNLVYRPAVPMVCIAHQYLLLSPHFPFPDHNWWNRQLVNFNTRVTALGAIRKLALSFRPIEGVNSTRLHVVPPLLRREIQGLHAESGDHLLVYMTQHGLSQQIIEWHRSYPDQALHCFWDHPEAPDELAVTENLTFHRINATKYLRLMKSCKALVTTAGFESVCEAMYLGKPVLMVPVPGHFEQACNAIDGTLSGAGIASDHFDLSLLQEYLPVYKSPENEFRQWYIKGDSIFIKELEEIAAAKTKKSSFFSVKIPAVQEILTNSAS